jgi:hypothetical protein
VLRLGMELEVPDRGPSQEVPDCGPSLEVPDCETSPEALRRVRGAGTGRT